MTDKRFKMGESDIQGEMIFIDTQTNKIYWQEYFDEIVDLLNELAEENEQQAIIEQQEQAITILKQEIADTQAILEMLSEKLKGWNNE